MKLGIVSESHPRERRVALTPAAAAPLIKAGLTLLCEAGAGRRAGYPDEAYRAAGFDLVDRQTALAADLLLMVRAAGANREQGRKDLPLMHKGQTLVALCDALSEPAACRDWASRGVSIFALDLMPRITRAQSMDVLSAMSTLAGYRAAILAASHLPRVFPMLMTAAGTLTAAKVLVLGAGVAGLQAIATARRLGAVVSAYDVRPAGREQAASLGAKVVDLALDSGPAEGAGGYAKALSTDEQQRQRDLLADVIALHDVVIATAAVPGKPAPLLISAAAVRRMPAGGVIVDLAAERGGNCELTRPGETFSVDGVTILGATDLAADVPGHASQMFARNAVAFLTHIVSGGTIRFADDDEIIRETLVARDGSVVHDRCAAFEV